MWNANEFCIERYNVLKLKKQFYPQRILDIGANVGQWYKSVKTVWMDAEVLSIEANPSCELQLKQVNPNSIITFLGQKEGTTQFYTTDKDPLCTGASAYLEQTNYYNDPIAQELPVTTLDSLGQQFDFIKMDVQGAELDIIKGGLNTILNSSILQLELSMLEYNQGAPLASEIIAYLYSLDFYLFDIGSFFFWDGMTNQSDMFFVNKRKLPDFSKIPEFYRYV